PPDRRGRAAAGTGGGPKRGRPQKNLPTHGQVLKAGWRLSRPPQSSIRTFDPKACTFPLTQAGFLASGGISTTAFPRNSAVAAVPCRCRLQWRVRSVFAPDSLLAFRRRNLHQLSFPSPQLYPIRVPAGKPAGPSDSVKPTGVGLTSRPSPVRPSSSGPGPVPTVAGPATPAIRRWLAGPANAPSRRLPRWSSTWFAFSSGPPAPGSRALPWRQGR